MVRQKTLGFLLVFFIFGTLVFGQEPSDPTLIFNKIKSSLNPTTMDQFQHSVKRMGNKKITLEAFISLEADWNKLKKIATQVSDYPKWVFPRINDRGGGEKFFIQFASISALANHPNTLDIDVFLNLPALKIPVRRLFLFEPVPHPDSTVFIMRVTALAVEDSPVKDLSGFAYFFKNPKNPSQIFSYLDVSVVLTHWLVYEALPERLLTRDIGDRLKILMENYQNYENTHP